MNYPTGILGAPNYSGIREWNKIKVKNGVEVEVYLGGRLQHTERCADDAAADKYIDEVVNAH